MLLVEAARKLATYDDLLALPDDVKAEVVDGVIVTPPAPLPRHSRAQGAIRRFIGGPYDDDDGRGGPGGWWILLETDIRFAPHVILRPDLAGWRRARLPSPWDTRPIDVAPDWICEVLSPSNEAHDRVRKRRLYAKEGIRFFWIVDPVGRTLEALRLETARPSRVRPGSRSAPMTTTRPRESHHSTKSSSRSGACFRRAGDRPRARDFAASSAW